MTDEIKGFKKITIDSSALWNYSYKSISDLLVQQSDIFIKSYGMGGSATPSFRGTGASHTQLQWNNININSPMLGQADLSLIPAGLIDEVDLLYGGSSMTSGTGGIGGMINLETKPVWRKETMLSFNSGAGSFGQYTGLVKVRTGNANFQSVTKAYIDYAENNFSYLNTVRYAEPETEVMESNEALQKGFMQEIYFRKSKNVLSGRFWYQSADRNLPSSTLVQPSGSNEKQLDESFRTMINYTGSSRFAEYYLTGSYSLCKLDYSNKTASIDSRNNSQSVIFKGGISNRISETFNTRLIFENENTIVKSENYSGSLASRNVASITALTEINSAGRIGASILLREILHGNSFLIPDVSTGLQIKLSDSKDYYLKANYTRNSKLPSMNDLYWAPGGNKELASETANMFELIYEMTRNLSSPLVFKFNISGYHNSIDNLIQWRPGSYAYWIADNVKSVRIIGLESSASFIYSLNNLSSTFKVNYNYTSSKTTGSDIQNDESIGKQLIYVPENQLSAFLKFSYLNIYASLLSNYTGIRFTSSDNSSYLPGYLLNSISSGYSFHQKSNVYTVSLTIDNLLNEGYETIAYYPQPGRSFSLKILIQFLKQ